MAGSATSARPSSASPAAPSTPSALALGLGHAGLLPFVGTAAWLLAGPVQQQALAAAALAAYAATIVSFLGGIHWGLAFAASAGPPGPRLAWGVVPSLLAWPALLLPAPFGLAVLAGTLVLCYGVDHRVYPGLGLSAWLPLRRRLSAVAALSCAAGVVALA